MSEKAIIILATAQPTDSALLREVAELKARVAELQAQRDVEPHIYTAAQPALEIAVSAPAAVPTFARPTREPTPGPDCASAPTIDCVGDSALLREAMDR